ncbi:photosystem I reaction center subunit VIII [Anabaena azotica]|uniref:Photosystem I reaction center subunit VIII n=1 Tax=Anabaena azotica FACHB-119 TaxID=947527 RepID=A0ABR8CVU3_9NOST|nr:photosystem I reaction center subunit VIII [Anabaena azotica]MBD2499045.1 photosystem I reaction center subunit VIII [Anabaena azotica FACHB-119]
MVSTLFPSLLAYSTFLPSLLVPLTGLVFPAVAFAFMFLYIEREDLV